MTTEVEKTGDDGERETTFRASERIQEDVTGNPAAGEERVNDGGSLDATEAATAFGNQNLDSDPDMIPREGGRA